MDLSSLDVSKSKGAILHLRSPVDDSLLMGGKDNKHPVTITLVGSDSPEYLRTTHKNQDARLTEVARRGKRVKILSEELEEDHLEALAACTKAWSNIVIDGAEVPLTTDNAKMLYRRFRWVSEQVNEFIENRANFLGK